MAEDTSKGEVLRAALAKYRERTRHGKYPEELRRRAVAYCAERKRGGSRVAEIAAELGVKDVTARAWVLSGDKRRSAAQAAPSDCASSLSLVPVVVRSEKSSTSGGVRLDVELPDGTRLAATGVSRGDLVEVIESLRRIR